MKRIMRLYEVRHAAEPGKGYDEQAAEWRAKLPAEGLEPELPRESEEQKPAP